MSAHPWRALLDAPVTPAASPAQWLARMLRRNRHCDYLTRYGSPASVQAFRQQVPPCGYKDIAPHIQRMAAGTADMLFAGRPVAWERTGGSTGGGKLIPYSRAGLLDVRHNVLPWLQRSVAQWDIRGKAYFTISPVTRAPESLAGVPVGLPDGAYLGAQAAAVLQAQSAVPPQVALLQDVGEWRSQTVRHLLATHDLEFISVWSPTFLLRLLDAMPTALHCWPRLKLVSCWTSAATMRHAQELQQRLPQTHIQPKGLLATEGVVTVPDTDERPALAAHGWIELLNEHGGIHLPHQAPPGHTYEVLLTTSSGLYRYRLGDHVQHLGCNATGAPVLAFVGRSALCSDLVGEKLTEAFVSACLHDWQGFALLLPDHACPGYVLVTNQTPAQQHLLALEQALCANPQYAHARKLGQLAALRLLCNPDAANVVERTLLQRGARLGDIKPLTLRSEAFWLPLLESGSPP